MRIVTGFSVGVVLVWGLSRAAIAQPVGTCETGQAEAYLDVAEVRARIFNHGGLFYGGDPPVYEVPKGGGISALFSTSIWVGGKVSGAVHMAAAHYSGWEFWPGPLGADGHPPADCARYDRIYEITRDDVDQYEQGGVTSESLRAWPVDLGAPVVDGDGVPGNFNLEGGDRPALVGDQMLWWVMNDRGNAHPSTKAASLGLEVQATAFAFKQAPALLGTGAFRKATFYRYRLIYKGEAPLDSAYFGIYADPDLGNFDDDYIGVDTTLALGYAYNADEEDEGDEGYGERPPAVGYVLLQGPEVDVKGNKERLALSSFIQDPWYCGIAGCMISMEDYFNNLIGLRHQGEAFTVGNRGDGFSDTPTRFMYPGDPVTGAFWSEENMDAQGTRSSAGDRSFNMSTGPFSMQPGDDQEIVFAIIWARGNNRLDSVQRLRSTAAGIRDYAGPILEPTPTTAPREAFELYFAPVSPNPFTGSTTLRYSVPDVVHVQLVVYDVLGRTVATLVDGVQGPGAFALAFNAQGLPGGVYFCQLRLNGKPFTQALVIQ